MEGQGGVEFEKHFVINEEPIKMFRRYKSDVKLS